MCNPNDALIAVFLVTFVAGILGCMWLVLKYS